MTDDSNRAKIEIVDELETYSPPQRNQLTRLKHRREVLWQITVPLVISILLVLVMAGLAVAATSSQASQLADISLIWLISPTYVFALIALVILVALIYGLIRLIMVLPFYTFRLHTMIKVFGSRLQDAGNKAVEPILRVQMFTASMRSLGRNIRGADHRSSSDLRE